MRPKPLSAIVSALMLALILASCSGCSLPQAYVEADRATYNVVAPDYLRYLEADETLDPNLKAARQATVATWELRIRKAEGK